MKRVYLSALCVSLVGSSVLAETVEVKYRGLVALDSFQCTEVQRSTLVKRVCYDKKNEYMIISLKGTNYHYCEIDNDTVQSLLSAESMGRYFNANIRGNGSDGPFDCRTHSIPKY